MSYLGCYYYLKQLFNITSRMVDESVPLVLPCINWLYANGILYKTEIT